MTEKYCIGIDIGGTFIKGAVVDLNGKIVKDGKVPSQTEIGPDQITQNIISLVKTLISDCGLTNQDICGIGMGSPGMVDSQQGTVVFAGNLGWEDYPIAQKVANATGLKVKVANDANVAALGEVKFGGAKDYDNIVMITLGTGVGGGIIVDGKMLEGNRSAGAEIGHTVIVYGGQPCTCGRKGCFEAYSSATALIRETKNAMLAHKNSKMWEIGSLDNVSGITAFDYAKKDEYAAEVIENYISYLACGIVNLANIFRPQAVLIGGGVCGQGDNLIKPLQKKVDAELFGKGKGPSVPIFVATLGNKAGVLGAAALVLSE